MKLQKLVDLSQIVGVILIVISLIFIGIEINQNTIATKASIRQSVAANDLTFLTSSLDPEVIAEANAKIADGMALTTKEREQLVWQQYVNFITFETHYYNYQIGYLDESLWKRYLSIIANLLQENPYARFAYKRFGFTFTKGFQAELAGIIEKRGIQI